jgi:hypothetical protein
VVGCCEDGDEPSVCMQGGRQFLDQLLASQVTVLAIPTCDINAMGPSDA